MNEEQMRECIQNLDNDLLHQELDGFMGALTIDMASISKKAHSKLNRERAIIKMKKKRIFAMMAASFVVVIGVTTAYASDISDFVKSFLNKTGVYATVVDGPAYYLESPVSLANGGELRKVLFAEDHLELILFMPDNQIPAELSVKTDEATRALHGFSKGPEGLELGFIQLKPCEAFELRMDGQTYRIALTSGEAVTSGDAIVPAEASSVDWVNLGYRHTENGIQILTSFTDKDLRLRAIGEPREQDVTTDFTNKEGGGVLSNGTSSSPKPLLGVGKDGKVYTYRYDPNGTGRPLTVFTSDAPAGAEIELNIPSLIVGYENLFEKVDVDLPTLHETETLNREIDLGLQKMVLETITRTSATTAELSFALNTGDQKAVSIREAGIDSADVQSGSLLWKADRCTMQITFREDLERAELIVNWPTFVVNGNWTLSLA